MMYCGMVNTCVGIIIVTIIRANQSFLPLKGIRAKPYATTAEDTAVNNVLRHATIAELAK